MYNYREITRFSEGCTAMCGDPSNWIYWAMDKEDADRLMIVDSNQSIIWLGGCWDKFKSIADILSDSTSSSLLKSFKLGGMFGGELSTQQAMSLLGISGCYFNDKILLLCKVAEAWLGRCPWSDVLVDQREYKDNIALYWLGIDEIPAHVGVITESFYYDFLTEMCLDDCEMVCVPNYYAQADTWFQGLNIKGCEEWLHSTGRLDYSEMLMLHRDSYGIEELLGFDAVHNAIRNYMDYMDSDFETMASDVSYTIEDVICNLKEGNYRFDINGNIVD